MLTKLRISCEGKEEEHRRRVGVMRFGNPRPLIWMERESDAPWEAGSWERGGGANGEKSKVRGARAEAKKEKSSVRENRTSGAKRVGFARYARPR